MSLRINLSFVAASLLAACGSKPNAAGPCATATPSPACSIECDPAGASTCPSGFHCAPEGHCTAECTSGGSECGDNSYCDADGRCVHAGDGPDANCPSVNFTATPTTPTVHLLLDQSGSMDAPYGNTDRWNAMRKALIDPTTGVVTRLQSKVVFGATLYSDTSHLENGRQVGDLPCPKLTSRPRALNNYTEIRNMLQGANLIDDTPTGDSIDAIVADFAAHPPAAGSPPIIVLATDGLPDTCLDADPPGGARQDAANAYTVTKAQAAYAAGIKLFFLFVGDGGQAGTHPQRMANAGVGQDPITGTAPFYVATNPAQLEAAFDTIIGGVLSCELDLDGNIEQSQAASGTVILNGTQLSYPTDWILVDSNTIRLVGSACTTLMSSPTPTVTAEFPCGAVIL